MQKGQADGRKTARPPPKQSQLLAAHTTTGRQNMDRSDYTGGPVADTQMALAKT